MPGGIILLIVAIVVISAVVGAIAQFLNKLNEANAPPPRRPNRGRPPAQAADRDMDRFLAEIDRLRKKNSEPQAEPTAARPQAPKPVPLPAIRARSNASSRGQRPEKAKKPRVAIERPEPLPQPRRRVDSGLMAPPPIPVLPGTLSPDSGEKALGLPIATVVTAGSSTGAPSATRVTHLPQRARPVPKTPFAQSLEGLLSSGQGPAMAIILQEILGPPKSRQS